MSETTHTHKTKDQGRPPNFVNDEMRMDVIRILLEGHTTAQVVVRANAEWKARGESYRIKEFQVRVIIQHAAKTGMLTLHPPPDRGRARALADAFELSRSAIDVTISNGSIDAVAARAAAVVREKMLALDKPTVGLGFGAGGTTSEVARHLENELFGAGDPLPDISFHALTTSFDVTKPSHDPTAFFTRFEKYGPGVRFVGLLAPPLIEVEKYGPCRTEPIIDKAVEQREAIDIIITSLAHFEDEHSQLKQLTQMKGAIDRTSLTSRKVVGDLMYCPYSAKEPIHYKKGKRVMTLFELEELRAFAATPGKEVILVCGPCPGCGKTRHEALRPLLAQSELRVFTHIVTDLETSRALLR